ncbi:MAG: fibronectin type III domain-containing protein [Planctomycetota bacterium]|nr:fibronectin type III domain-containing protein [Planctomycetota bacterium]
MWHVRFRFQWHCLLAALAALFVPTCFAAEDSPADPVTTDWYAAFAAWEKEHGADYVGLLCGGDVAWGESYILRMYVNLYNTFGERQWLDKIVSHVDRLVANLSDKPKLPLHAHVAPQYLDGYLGWGQSRYTQYKPHYTEWLCDDGLMISPILCFVEIVWNDQRLHDRYRDKADHYLAFLEKFIIDKWYQNWDPDPGWTKTDNRRFRQDRGYHVYEWSGWQNQPLNMYLAFTDGLVTLWRLSSVPHYKPHRPELPKFYQTESRRMLKYFHDQLRVDNQRGLNVWKYGPNTHWPDLIEDVGHGFIDIQAALQGVRQKTYFSETDLRRMGQTFVQNVWNGDLRDPKFRYYLDGAPSQYDATRGYWGFGFLYLAGYDYRIWESMASYFDKHVDLLKQEPYIAVTAAMLAIAAEQHDRWAPGVPRRLVARQRAEDLLLTWQHPTADADGTPLTGVRGYVVYQASHGDSKARRLNDDAIKAGQYVVAGAAEKSARYRVTAVDYRRNGNEGPAAEIVVAPECTDEHTASASR